MLGASWSYIGGCGHSQCLGKEGLNRRNTVDAQQLSAQWEPLRAAPGLRLSLYSLQQWEQGGLRPVFHFIIHVNNGDNCYHLLHSCYQADHGLGGLPVLFLMARVALWGSRCLPHFTDEKTEAQRVFNIQECQGGTQAQVWGPRSPCLDCSPYWSKDLSWGCRAFRLLRVGWSPHYTLFLLPLPHQSRPPGRERWGNLLFLLFEPRWSIKCFPVLKCLQSFLSTAYPTGSHFGSSQLWEALTSKMTEACLGKMFTLCSIQNTAACISNPCH